MRKDILSIRESKRIAIMGGTFDPIHYGHLVTAEAVRKEFNLEKVIFIPTGNPAFKQNKYVTNSEFRYIMAVLATMSNPYFEVSRIEIDRTGVTYTIDTIEEIRMYAKKDTEIYFITGADAINDILNWKDSDELLKMCNFVAVSRPGYDRRKLTEKILELEKKTSVKLYFMEVPSLAISSSDIRDRIQKNAPIKYLLPQEVETYIYKNNLYTPRDVVKEVEDILKDFLSPHRLTHSYGVADEAKKLSKFYNIDEDKAYIAGLSHDISKEFDDEALRKLCKKYNIKIDKVMNKNIQLVHGFLGAEMAKDFFEIYDEDILNSIRYHTTGRKNMSMLEKIIYLADMIEPNRKNFKGLSEIRDLAYKDIDEAMIKSLARAIEYTKEINMEVHKLSKKALNYYIKNKETVNGDK